MLRYSAKNCSWFSQLFINSVCIGCWNVVLNCKTDKTPWTYMEDRPSLTWTYMEDRPSLTEHVGPALPIMVSRLASVYSIVVVWFRKFKSSGMTCCVNGWAVNSILKALWLFETLQDISSPHSTVLTGSDGWQQQQAWRNSSVTCRWLRIQMYRKASANKAFITIWQYISTG